MGETKELEKGLDSDRLYVLVDYNARVCGCVRDKELANKVEFLLEKNSHSVAVKEIIPNTLMKPCTIFGVDDPSLEEISKMVWCELHVYNFHRDGRIIPDDKDNTDEKTLVKPEKVGSIEIRHFPRSDTPFKIFQYGDHKYEDSKEFFSVINGLIRTWKLEHLNEVW